ncbi:MAG: hypothetical protein GX286_04135 [Clostridiales bacterium]|nr:hypothetical protein [Clostridiales bacterium]
MVGIEVKEELKKIAFYSVFLNVAFFLISIAIIGIKISIPIGLLLGTAVMLLNMLLLGMFIERTLTVSKKGAQITMTTGYFLRLLIVGTFFFVSVKIDLIHPLGAMIPLFYPKLIYTGGAILKYKGGS